MIRFVLVALGIADKFKKKIDKALEFDLSTTSRQQH
jgi:hypothetical protein